MTQAIAIDSSERDAANQRNLRRLVVSVQASLHKLNLLIAICDNPHYRDELIRTYEAELTAKQIHCDAIQLDRQQPSLKQSLLDWQDSHPDWQPETPTLITVRGGDELLGIRLEQPKSAQERFFFSLQWTREALREFQFPVVLWLTQATANGLVQQAPDFWSWRGGVFEFDQPIAWHPADGAHKPEHQTESSDEPLADPAQLAQEIAALETEDPDSPLLASLYQSLGETYYNRLARGMAINRLQEEAQAIAVFQAAITRRETLPDPLPLATSLAYLGLLYKSQGRYELAEPLYEQALQLRRSLLGEQHTDVATSLNNLAILYESQGRYELAEPLLQQALQLRRSLLGEQHPDVAQSLNNLAGLYYFQGRYELAEPLYEQALQLRRSLLGEQHPDVAASLNNLAALYQSQGRYELAEPLYQQALQMTRSLLGEQHPDVAQSLNNLAVLYAYQGRFTEAEPLLVQALALRQQMLGDQHPDTVGTQQSLANVRQIMSQST